MSIISTTLEKELTKVVQQIRKNIDSTGKKATGKTQKAIHVEIQNDSNIRGQILAPDYIEDLETGTPPKAGYSFMDVNDLQFELMDWAKAKGLQVDNLANFTFRTAGLILSDGSKQYRNKVFTNVFTDEIDKAAKNIPIAISGAVVRQIYKPKQNREGYQITIPF